MEAERGRMGSSDLDEGVGRMFKSIVTDELLQCLLDGPESFERALLDRRRPRTGCVREVVDMGVTIYKANLLDGRVFDDAMIQSKPSGLGLHRILVASPHSK